MVITSIVFVISGYFAHQKMQQENAIFEAEILGIETIRPFNELLKLLPEHRGLTFGYLSGEQNFAAQRQQKHDAINHAFGALQNHLDKRAQQTKEQASFTQLKVQWQTLESQLYPAAVVDAKQSFELHNQLISQLLLFYSEVSDDYKLTLEPDLANYYLMDLSFHILPRLVNEVGQVRGFSAGLASLQDWSKVNQFELIQYIADAKYVMEDLIKAHRILEKALPNQKVVDIAELYAAENKLDAYLSDSLQLLATDTASFVSQDRFKMGTEMLGYLFAEQNMAMEFLYQRLNQALTIKKSDQRLFLIGLFFSILLVNALVYVGALRYSQKVGKEKRQVEHQAARNQAWSEAIIESSTDGIHVLDEKANLVFCNNAFAQMLGYSKAELLNMSVFDWDTKNDPVEIRREMFNQAIMHMDSMSFEALHTRKDGTYFYVELIAQKMVFDGKTYMFASARDIDARKKAEVSLQQTQKALEASYAELSEQNAKQKEIFAIIAHELRTPAAAMQMILSQENVVEKLNRGKMLLKTSNHLLTILDDMRAVIHPEAVLEGKVEDAKLHNLIYDAIALQGKLLKSHQLQPNFVADKAAKLFFHFNVQLLRQIAFNLVKNCALHAQASHLWVSIVLLDEQDDCMTFEVHFRDDGKGISETDQANLFQKFSRGNTEAGGSGLGLYLSRQFAREHLGGDLIYQPSPEGGSEFILTVTLNKANPQEANHPASPTDALNDLSGYRLLLAEDDLLIRELTQVMLEEKGAQVVAFENGQKALEAAQSQTFDAVITDAFMPVMDGFELVAQLRKLGYTQPIIAVTAATIGFESKRLVEAGVTGVISKPLDMAKLLQLLASSKSI
ncbi:hypothetical protein THMIRHAT_03060 [Thiosulfativibrio zosterae]|uniref:histidine kinase n=2 Tax=Thiosulfativibrio zosterae TaxID=2675053 RepID=A0A6F8PKN5_9GAMM|nr:hypothetical protein THMIRHAT_03060 [Thiosulfativibrio zosterae]